MSTLGIDIGTSGLRALLVGRDGVVIGSAERSYATTQPQSGWSEQDPSDWITALESAVQELRATHEEFAQLQGIGVAGHMHGATLLDAEDKVLRPCIMWNDTRSHAEAAALDAQSEFRELSGNIVFPGFTAPKLEWVHKNEPDIFACVAKVLLPAACLNFYLSGEYFSDMSDCAGTSWLDVGKREWSETLLANSHMRVDQMPRLVEGTDAAGVLREELAERWGLAQRPVIAGGAGDNAAAACGLGVINVGQGFVSLGTSGVLLLARKGFSPAPETAVHSFCHAVPERWYQMGVMLSAADSLSWLASITGESAEALTLALGDEIKGPGSVGFLPYLSGERTPHNDAEIRGSFTGLDTTTSRQDMTRAVLEGVCFGLRDCYEALGAGESEIDGLFVTGGGSASRYWVALLATVLNTPLHILDGREFGAALGAARLGVAAATGAPIEQIMVAATPSETILPDSDLVGAFDRAYARFRAAYPAIRALTEEAV